MAHETMNKFGYPDTLIREYQHWTVQLRPKQATAGALVLICKEEVEAFSAISVGAFAELAVVVSAIETALRRIFSYDKINYLMLMMVDRQVHFHVIPRYATPRFFGDVMFLDPGWPGVPDLGADNRVSESLRSELLGVLRQAWS